jgi:flavin-dependent dehydrogenase
LGQNGTIGPPVDVVTFDHRVPWEKPCGGGLTPALFEELPEFEEVRSLARPVHRARVEVGPETAVEVELDSPICVISREVLGRWQLDRALEAGVTHEPTKVQTIRSTDDGWVLSTDRGAWEVSYLVGADGAASTVRHVAAPGCSVEQVPARVAYSYQAGDASDLLVLRFYNHHVGYLWDFPRLDHHSIGIEMTGGSWRRPELDERIDEYREWSGSDPYPPPLRAGAVIGTAQLGHGDFSQIAGRGFALLGDAAGFADPFTGEGILNALRSASLLAQARGRDRGEWSEAYSILARKAFSREFAIARLLRRALAESGAGVRLVELGMSSDVAYAAMGAMLNTIASHDYSLSRLLTRWYRAIRSVRVDPGLRGPKGTLSAESLR